MFQEPYMKKIIALVGIMAGAALIAYTYSTIKETRYMTSMPTQISVSGEGKIFATPDIATFSFGIESKEADAETAQNKSAEVTKAILAYLKESGVEDKDVKTDYYNFMPRYEYPQVVCTQWGCPSQGEPKLIGYQVSQSITVKVRDTKKAGELVSGVGSKGAINVSSLSFTIDDKDALKAEAREKAIADAKENAKKLADDLGVRLTRMTGYWEDESNGYPMPYGMGGGGNMMKAESADSMMSQPAELPLGENTITSRVTISYEIRGKH